MTETVTSIPAADPTPTPPPAVAPRQLRRSRDRVFAGVASGIAEYTGLPVLLVRLLFVGAAFMGWGVFLYPVLWLVIPDAETPGAAGAG